MLILCVLLTFSEGKSISIDYGHITKKNPVPEGQHGLSFTTISLLSVQFSQQIPVENLPVSSSALQSLPGKYHSNIFAQNYTCEKFTHKYPCKNFVQKYLCMSVFVYSCQRFVSITLTLVSLIYVQVVTSPQCLLFISLIQVPTVMSLQNFKMVSFI